MGYKTEKRITYCNEDEGIETFWWILCIQHRIQDRVFGVSKELLGNRSYKLRLEKTIGGLIDHQMF